MTKPHNEDAWTETVYALLILVVTVSVASLIAVYAFGIPGAALQNTNIIALSADQSGADINVRYYGNVNDHPGLTSLSITAPNGTVFMTVSTSGALGTTGTPVKPDAGTVLTLSGAGTSGMDQVIVVGNFKDDSAQVVLAEFV